MRTHILTLAGGLTAALALAACGDNAGSSTDECESACDAPPAARCDGDTYIAYAPVGECVDGECRYETVSETCAGGCGTDGCVAVPCEDADCTTPPAAACDGNTALTYVDAGTCSDGECAYAETRTNCEDTDQTCQDGACVDPVVDPCEGVTCETPPAAACDGNTALAYVDAGTCSDGECAYAETRTNCEDTDQTCQDGACVDPIDLCADVVCDELPDDTCDESGNRLVYSTGECVAADGSCDYVPNVLPCDGDSVCVEGACIPVVTPCDDVVCDEPPATACASDTELQTWASVGTCAVVDDAAVCTYANSVSACDTATPACFESACRAVPTPGDLQITEILYDAAGDDDGAEWVEIRNTTATPLLLRGLVASSDESLVALDTMMLAGEAFLVLEASAAATPVEGVLWTGMALNNEADTVQLLLDGTPIESIAWSELDGRPDAAGRSLSLDPAAADSSSPASWCFGTAAYDASGSLGTPGATNPACDFACFDVECPAPVAFCDGDVRVTYSGVGACDSSDGTCDYTAVEVREDCAEDEQMCETGSCVPRPRNIAAGAVIVNEFLANASVGPTGKWIELFNTTEEDIDLDGVVMTDESERSVTIVDVTIPAGGFVVLTAAADTLADGADFIWGDSEFGMGDNQDSIVLTFNDTEIDRVDYNVSTWPIEPDAAAAFAGGVDDSNNDPDFWCVSRVEIGDGTLGTPGAANDDCTTEELPDPPDLAAGDLVIAEIMMDPTGISDEAGEWFEIYNRSGAPIDVRGLEIRSDSGSIVLGRDGFFVDDRSPVVPNNGLLVVGRSVGALGELDEATSRVSYVQEVLLLGNAGDTLSVWAGATMVDTVAYTTGWPLVPGFAMSADTFALTATANDEALAWCEAPFEAVYATFSDGVTSFPQRGTPGVVNEFCGFGF